MRIYIDFDDVICETAKYFTKIAKELFGIDVPYRQVGEPAVENLRRYVGAAGFLSMRFGVPSVPGERTVGVYDPTDEQAFGLHEVSRPPYTGPQHSASVGIAPPAAPAPITAIFFRSSI